MTDTSSPDVSTGPDVSKPHSSRVYNYLLGGKDNFAPDREAGDRAVEALPSLPLAVKASRAFGCRAVRFLAGECGVRQFLDIGVGLPFVGSVHEVAQRVDSTCRGGVRR